MKKLLFKIYGHSLIVKEKFKMTVQYKNIINTNVISSNELIFSDEYLQNNTKIVSSFITELCENYDLNTVVVEKLEYTPLVLLLLKNNLKITNLVINEDEQLTYTICESIKKTNIKSINCYNLQPFLIEYLDKNEIIVESRNEILFISNFMQENNLSLFSSLFYKMRIKINLPMKQQDEEDFKAFCKINKYLKVIDVNTVNKNDLEFIIDILRKNNKKNIKILIHENLQDNDTAEYLKNYNKRKSKKYKIYFKLVYSDEYLKNNIIKQTNNNILKGCGYLIILIIGFTFLYVFYDNYKSMQRVNVIQDNLKKVIKLNTSEASLDNNKDSSDNADTYFDIDVASVYEINPETVGWLKINNTNIDYPVVQTTNNEYYLNHNIYNEKDKNGWVFMDYRDDINLISDNIIIYAHNRYYNGVMFGTLQNTMRKSWYTNPDNQIITLKTMKEELHYRIFAMYKIEATTDYLGIIYPNDEEKLETFNMFKDRSLYDFGIELKKDDKILTLSTCADENNRYVVHAVLEKEA